MDDTCKCGRPLDGEATRKAGKCDRCLNREEMRRQTFRGYAAFEAGRRGLKYVHCLICGRFATERDDYPLNDGRCDRCLEALTTVEG